MAGTIMAGQTSNYNFDYPTSTDYVKDGATAIQELADDVDATLFTALGGDYPGLRLVKTQTIGSAVSAVTVTNAFSATYQNYLIMISDCTTSGLSYIAFKLGSSTTGYYQARITYTYTGTASLGFDNNTSQWTVGLYTSGGTFGGSLQLTQPFLAKHTTLLSQSASNTVAGTVTGVHQISTSHTDFTITGNAGTMTGGTIQIYGYGVS
jgi:hypothetical protein